MVDLVVEEPSSHAVVRSVVVGDIINDKYEVTKELGEGGFGLVLEVIDRRTKERLAMKVELFEPKPDEPGIQLEASVLRRLQGYSHILKYHDEGSIDNLRYLVMQLAGSSLSDLRRYCPQRHFTTCTTVLVALQTLRAVENIHVSGLLHRDIKPANFAVGMGDEKRQIYILDFGLVRRYRLKNGKCRPQRNSAGFRGSIRYASVNAHKNVDLGRNDDLWSWLYTIVELRKGTLPWSYQMSKKGVGEMKAKTTCEELLADMQPEYNLIFISLEKLTYHSLPPYAVYRDQLMKIIKLKKYSTSTSPYDWEQGGRHFEHTQHVQPQRDSKLDKADNMNISKRDDVEAPQQVPGPTN